MWVANEAEGTLTAMDAAMNEVASTVSGIKGPPDEAEHLEAVVDSTGYRQPARPPRG